MRQLYSCRPQASLEEHCEEDEGKVSQTQTAVTDGFSAPHPAAERDPFVWLAVTYLSTPVFLTDE